MAEAIRGSPQRLSLLTAGSSKKAEQHCQGQRNQHVPPEIESKNHDGSNHQPDEQTQGRQHFGQMHKPRSHVGPGSSVHALPQTGSRLPALSAEPASRESLDFDRRPAYGLVGATAPKLTSGIADDSSDGEFSFRFSDIGILDGLLSMIF
jgi:hypothetical protein